MDLIIFIQLIDFVTPGSVLYNTILINLLHVKIFIQIF